MPLGLGERGLLFRSRAAPVAERGERLLQRFERGGALSLAEGVVRCQGLLGSLELGNSGGGGLLLCLALGEYAFLWVGEEERQGQRRQ